MSRPLDYHHTQLARNTLNAAVEKADEIFRLEYELMMILYKVDQKKFFARYGYKSLMGFCHLGLKLTKTQSQRIITHVRRYDPMANIEHKTLLLQPDINSIPQRIFYNFGPGDAK